MADGRKQLGAWGESVAAHHLEAKGYRILGRNWRCRPWGNRPDHRSRCGLVFVE
ncbi:MAG: YraN family protein [Chloroflexi bacterium]|nr:YraN family protein [Chloroflexota bacterium]